MWPTDCLCVCPTMEARACLFMSHITLSQTGIKIYISLCWSSDYHWSFPRSKQLGEFKGICHASLLRPHPGDESEGHETGKADKNKSLINTWALNAKPSLFCLCLRALREWQFFLLICAHIVEKRWANILAKAHSTNHSWLLISKVTLWIQKYSTTIQLGLRMLWKTSVISASL